MKNIFYNLFLCFFVLFGYVDRINGCEYIENSDDSLYWDIYPDTWVATDALGRMMPDHKKVGDVKRDKQRIVGIFYVTWHSDALASLNIPYQADVSKVLKKDPKARLDGNHKEWTAGSYHWGEPEMGYFLSKDEYVIRKDMSMLADAGVDVLIMDVTNAVRYWDEWDVLFNTMLKMKAEGNKVPKFCFWAFNGPVISVVQDLYDKVYKLNKYKDLWFYWEGKPLLLYSGNPKMDANGGGVKNPNPHYDPAAITDLSNPHYGDKDYTDEFYEDYTKEVKSFFTLRTMWWGYYEWAGERFVGTEDKWSFGYDLGDKRVFELAPMQLASTHNGKVEQMAVTPAQHPISIIGKSWNRQYGEPVLDEYDMPDSAYVSWLGKKVNSPTAYGIYFQERWDEALQVDPAFLYINDWNEWTAGKYVAGKAPGSDLPGPTTFLGRENPFYFVDQYNAEFNRTIQPMKGGYTDNYYMQMAQNIRRYKGARAIPKHNGYRKIKIDGTFSDWDNVKIEYRDTKGDVTHRDYNGYGGNHYINNSGRNDILRSKVAVDKNNIYFYVETASNLTNSSDSNWMLLFIDADNNSTTGWYGYDFVINKNIIDNKTTELMKYEIETNKWIKVETLRYRVKENKMELKVNRKLLGCHKDKFIFDFKWADNISDLKDPISFCINGDSAPNRRFNYRFIWSE